MERRGKAMKKDSQTPIVAARKAGIDLKAIERSNLGERTKYKYSREIDKYLATGASLTDRAALIAYGAGLKSSSRSFFKAALRLLTADFEKDLKANVTPGSLAETQAALMRLEAIRDAVEVHTQAGTKAHAWLSQAQVKQITALPGTLYDDNLEGWRDWIVLGLLLGAGLRREELAGLTFEALKTQSTKRGRMRDILEVKGKGEKSRVIPIKPLLGANLRKWKELIHAKSVDRIAPR